MSETKESAAPVTQNITLPPSLGLDGLYAKIANFSAVVLVAGIAIYGVLTLKSQLDYLRADLKDQQAERRAETRESHNAFLQDARESREQMSKQWDEVRELHRLNQQTQSSVKEGQDQTKALIEEVKRIKQGGSQ